MARHTGPLAVVGDALLDVDVTGRAGRLAPDAPVPVLDELDEVRRPGGAALAAVLAAGSQRADREVVLVTALGDDADAEAVAALVREAGVRLVAFGAGGATPVKRRVRAGGQSLLRLDSGGTGAPSVPGPEVLHAIRTAGAVLVSDYGRGVVDLEAVRVAVASTAPRVPVVWDPHPRGSGPVDGVRLVTPNRDEASRMAQRLGVDVGGARGLAQVNAHACALVTAWRAHGIAVTLGSGGALLSHGEESPSVFPAPRVQSADTCGAGDRFAASAALALASGALPGEAVQEAVLSAAAFVAAGGASALSTASVPATTALDPVARARATGGTVVATGGCFDLLHAGHVATLEAARRLGDCVVVCLNSDESVRRLKGPGRPLVPQADRARVLAALEPVDAVVVFDEDTPEQALARIRPDVWVKGGDYAGTVLPEAALLGEWGGQAVVVPYLEGRSTTSLVTSAAERAGASAPPR